MIRKPEAGTSTEKQIPDSDAPTDVENAGVSKSAMRKGFTDLGEPQQDMDELAYLLQPPGGFVGRAGGWER